VNTINFTSSAVVGGVTCEIQGWLDYASSSSAWKQISFKGQRTGDSMGGLFRFKVGGVVVSPPAWSAVPAVPYVFGIASIFSLVPYVTSSLAVTFSQSGSFPPGLTVTSAGLLSADATLAVGTYSVQVTATDSNGQAAVSSPISVVCAIGTHPPVWSSTTLITVQQGSNFNLNVLCTDQDAGDSITFTSLLTLPAGVSLNQNSGVLSVGSGVAVAAYTIRCRGTDTTNRTADSQNITLSVVAQPTLTVVTIPQDEQFTVVVGPYALPAPATGLFPTTYAMTGAPTGVTLRTSGGIPTGVVDVALTTQTGTYSIVISRTLNNASQASFQFSLVVTAALVVGVQTGFQVARTGIWFRNLAQIQSGGNLQPGDQINCIPDSVRGRTYYGPDGVKYCAVLMMINGNPNPPHGIIKMVSTVPGQKWTLDTSDSRQGRGSNYLLGGNQNASTGSGNGILTMNQFAGVDGVDITDGAFVGMPILDAQDDTCAFYMKGLNTVTGRSDWNVKFTSCLFGPLSNGLRGSPDAAEIGAAHYADDTSKLTVINSEFRGCGNGGGNSHNAYVGHFAVVTLTGCYSHSEGADGHLWKCYSKKSIVTACRFTDELGTASFHNDWGAGGDVTIQGCIYEKGPGALNSPLISFGRQWFVWPTTDGRTDSLRVYQCTMVGYLSNQVFFDYGSQTGGAGSTIITLANNDIQDNILAGPNTPALVAGAVTTVANGPQFKATTINTSNVIAATTTAQFTAVFSNPANYDFSLIVAPGAVTGSEVPTTLAYSFPVGTVVRTDTSKGAYVTGLPFYATQALLPSGTWREVTDTPLSGFQKLNQIPLLTGKIYSSQEYTGNLGNSGILEQWAGGVFAPDYSQYGGLAVTGGGHAGSGHFPAHYNSVCVWNATTAGWEMTTDPWYDENFLLPASLGIHGPGNPAATLKWLGSGDFWVNGNPSPSTQEQLDATRGSYSEYVDGEPAGSHQYGYTCILPSSAGGGTKGMLVTPCLPSAGVKGTAFGVLALHGCDLSKVALANGTNRGWSRLSNDLGINQNAGIFIGCAVADPRRRKIYMFQDSGRFNVWDCTTPSASTWVRAFGMPNNSGTQAFYNVLAYVPSTDPADTTGAQDILLHVNFHTGQIYACWAVDVANGTLTTGFWNPQPTGTKPSTGVNLNWDMGGYMGGFEWCLDLTACCFLDYYTTGGSNPNGIGNGDPFNTGNFMDLWKVTVPMDRKNGTYAWSKESLNKMVGTTNTGAPTNPRDWNGEAGCYGKFRYNQKGKYFMLCDLEGMLMRIFRPTGLV
jgi:hypothetical protein